MDIEYALEKVKHMIKGKTIPVVSLIAQREHDPFKILISTMLSARTKDKATKEACDRLFSKAKNAEELSKLSIKEIETLIYPVGFYKVKAKHLKQTAKIISKTGVPETEEGLLKLPGVGIKTAHLVLIEAFDKNEICVDTHVHRISNRWEIVKTKTPEETDRALRKVLPKKLWKNYNFLLVSFGQTICGPKPKCQECELKEICPYYKKINRKEVKSKN